MNDHIDPERNQPKEENISNPKDSATEKDAIPAEIEEILEKVSESDRQFVLARLVQIKMSMKSHFVGPIPRPEDLERYNKIIPNGADRIMSRAEKQSDHRMQLEDKVISRQQNQSGRGQIFAFIISLLFLIAAWDLGKSGEPVLAGVIGGTTLVSLATVFIVGKKLSKSDKDEPVEIVEDEES